MALSAMWPTSMPDPYAPESTESLYANGVRCYASGSTSARCFQFSQSKSAIEGRLQPPRVRTGGRSAELATVFRPS
eukprot:1608778-Rhodomonas_salina.1